MEAQALTTEARQSTGKGAARQLRLQGKVPGVYYAKGVDSIPLTVSPKELSAALSTSHRRNRLISLEIGGDSKLAIVQELQVSPVSRAILHVDFVGVDLETPIARKVPFKTIGKAAGVVSGGDLRVLFRELPFLAPADKFPDVITVDVTKLQQGEGITVKDLDLEAGVVVQMPDDRNLITIAAPRTGGRGNEADEADEADAG